MPSGVYPRKKKGKKHSTSTAVEVFKPGEIPLDLIPDRPQAIVRPRITQEGALIGLCHRMIDQQDRLLDLLSARKPGRKVKVKTK